MIESNKLGWAYYNTIPRKNVSEGIEDTANEKMCKKHLKRSEKCVNLGKNSQKNVIKIKMIKN